MLKLKKLIKQFQSKNLKKNSVINHQIKLALLKQKIYIINYKYYLARINIYNFLF